MALGVGTILRRYVTYALRNPSSTYLADFDLRFRPVEVGQGGIAQAVNGSFAFVDTGAPSEVDGFGINGSGRPVYAEAVGAVAVRVSDSGHARDKDLAERYAQAARLALFSGDWTGFTDHDGATLALNHFDFYVGGRNQPSRIIRQTSPNGEPYFLVVTQYRGTAQPTA